jgi:hypothetical protein
LSDDVTPDPKRPRPNRTAYGRPDGKGSLLLGLVMLGGVAVGGWYALTFVLGLFFGPSFPHEMDHKDAYIFGRVIAEDEGNYADAVAVCANVLTALDRDVPDAFDGDGTRDDFTAGCTGSGPAVYEVTDSYRTAVHSWMEKTTAP